MSQGAERMKEDIQESFPQVERPSTDPAVDRVVHDTEELANANVIDFKSIPKDHPEAMKRHLLRELERAKNAEARVQIFAHVVDVWGLDAALGFFFPEIGDLGVAGVSWAYLSVEAYKAGLSKTDAARIAFYQLLDFAIGAVPIVGDFADYFWKANKKSAALFEQRRKEVVEEAIKAGVPQEEVNRILENVDRLRAHAGKAIEAAKVIVPPKKDS